MAIGFPTDKVALDARLASITVQIRDNLRAAADLKTKLDALTTDDLQALGYTAGEADIIKSAAADLGALDQVANGHQAQTPANDFLFWARKATGWQ